MTTFASWSSLAPFQSILGNGLRAMRFGPGRQPAQIAAFQTRCLRAIVRQAYDAVPYYRTLFQQAGVQPEDIRTLDDIQRIPISSRSAIQETPIEQICRRDVRPQDLLFRSTSGSSGRPLQIRRSWMEEQILLALRAKACRGYGLGVRSARISVRWEAEPEQDTTLLERFGLAKRHALSRRSSNDDVARTLRQARADFIEGPPSLLAKLASVLTENDRALGRAKVILTGSESLTLQRRREIERGFGAPIRDIYGSHEFVFIAGECPHGGPYHVADESLIVEVLRDGEPVKPGETGELVGTALHSYAMPFIRYRLGDLVVRGEGFCRCGALTTVLERIDGRVLDQFHLADGSVLHAYDLSSPLRTAAPWLRQFQIVQYERKRILIKAVALWEPSVEECRHAIAPVREVLGENAEVDLKLVESIPRAHTGKLYPYISFERLEAWREHLGAGVLMSFPEALGRDGAHTAVVREVSAP